MTAADWGLLAAIMSPILLALGAAIRSDTTRRLRDNHEHMREIYAPLSMVARIETKLDMIIQRLEK